MKKLSLRRISLVGLVLMVASVATAAVISNNNKPTFGAGSLTGNNTNDGLTGKGTCSQTNVVDNDACNATTGQNPNTRTTADANSNAAIDATANNTTQVDS